MNRRKSEIEARALALVENSRSMAKQVIQGLSPESAPQKGHVRFGSFRQTKPIAGSFGYGREGTRIGRHYVHAFIQSHSDDIRGRVLEIGDNHVTKAFGGDRVTQSDVLHAEPGNPDATVVGDMATGEGVPVGVYDCIILTQVIQCVYDVRSAIKHACAGLKPGGVVLLTTQAIGQISRYDMDRWGDYWRFTSQSARRLFEEYLPSEWVHVETYGNVLTAMGLLHGLSIEELTPEEMDYHDEDYQVIVAVRAQKPIEA